MLDRAALDLALDGLPRRLPGPGGVAGVVHEGRVIARLAWGCEDISTARPMTAESLFPICSITKQFTCAALLEAVGDTSRLDARVADHLPNFTGTLPTVAQMAHNQSGLRDSWALTVLHGAQPEGRFEHDDAPRLFAQMRTGHFAPGTHYSYCNANFRIISDLLEDATDTPIAQHYDRLFDRFGMETARLAADTSLPLDTAPYEGNADTGWLRAINRIWWQGDAGLAASLDDMLAYEQAIDAMRDDPGSIYGRLSAPVTFADGAPARYGWGLAREDLAGIALTGHGGALRGWRSRRIHAAAERLSVVVMVNHDGNAHAAAQHLLRAALGEAEPARTTPDADWHGDWIDDDSGLLASIGADGLRWAAGNGAEALGQVDANRLTNAGTDVTRNGDGVTLSRPGENLRATLRPVSGVATHDIAGAYHCAETGSTMTVAQNGPAWTARFDGLLGQGPAEPMEPVGTDIWAMYSRRGMDAAPPGRWTVQVERDTDGRIAGLVVGCWLARKLAFRRT